MKERGIIFCQDLIPGVMSGAITVTSRIITPQPDLSPTHGFSWKGRCYGANLDNSPYLPNFLADAPFRVGERYVKEAWQAFDAVTGKPILGSLNPQPGICVTGYKATEGDRAREYHDAPYGGPWRSPMFMPRWAARTWIEILAVKPARCQEITTEEILASGVRNVARKRRVFCCSDGRDYGHASTLLAYVSLWNRLNEKRRGFPWSLNAWVWRCTFRTVCTDARRG